MGATCVGVTVTVGVCAGRSVMVAGRLVGLSATVKAGDAANAAKAQVKGKTVIIHRANAPIRFIFIIGSSFPIRSFWDCAGLC